MSSRPYDLELIQQSRLPETWPALQAIVIDDENRIWVSTIIDNLEEYEWWVLSPEGQLQAKFRWPVGRVIRKIKSGNVYARETDEETGIQTIARYRIGLEENR